jgi:DNA-binding NtrC family response regulator
MMRCPRDQGACPQILGEHPDFFRLKAEAERAASLDLPILITGETGTGKGLLARFIHDSGHRRRSPFVAVDCGSLSADLARSELFGARKGSYTGAVLDRKGLVAEAQEGTLFLDEVGELGTAVQAQLLTLLQDREYRPIGQGELSRSSARILAATNRDIADEALGGGFRSDLYYRLAVVTLHVPPLRDRGRDIILLARHFLELCHRDRLPLCRLTGDAINVLMAYAWPGNVRELAHCVARCALRAKGGVIRGEDVELDIGMGARQEGREDIEMWKPYKAARRTCLDHFNRDYLHQALIRAGGNVSEAARNSGIGRQYFQLRMAEQGIRSGDYRNR